MIRHKALESKRQALLDIAFVPAVARLPATVPIERRDVKARQVLLSRVHSEFEEMRGLSLTLGQAARLFGLSPEIASRIFGQLTAARLLRQRSDGRFALHIQR